MNSEQKALYLHKNLQQMIYVRDKGRMCNNILQYGHLYAWGRKHGRRTLSMRFAYKYPYFHITTTPGHNFFRYLVGKYGAKTGLLPVVQFHEKGGDTRQQELTMLTKKNVVAEGWEARFYSEFIEYFEEIKALFAFNENVRQSVAAYLTRESVADEIKVGIHIRRGDYCRWNGGKYFFSDEQYLELMNRFVEYLSAESRGVSRPITFYVCGNDPTLNEQKFIDEIGKISKNASVGRRISIRFPKGNPGEDLYLLSECDYLAGPPSTFTLVASMYHEQPLYWVSEPGKPIVSTDFGYFRDLFRHIL